MMTDDEVSGAIQDLKMLTTANDIRWTQRADGHSFETKDLAEFTVVLSFDEAGNINFQINDDDGPAAQVSAGDDSTTAENISLLGATYELLLLVRKNAGSQKKSKWDASVDKQSRQPGK